MRLTLIFVVGLLMLLSIGQAKESYAGADIAYQDTLEVSGANTVHLSRYVHYWVDSSKTAGIDMVERAFQQGLFKHWPLHTNLNIGLNPYPLWIQLNIKHVALEKKTYWWSLYNQADSIIVFQKQGNGRLLCTDTLSYTHPMTDRKVPVRFQAIPLVLDASENRTLFVKVVNLRTPQAFVTDFTTPAGNLLWEQEFYWSVGVFAGCFLFVLFGSLIAAAVAREQVLWIYALYMLTILFLLLSQELLLTILPDPLFHIAMRIHPLLVVFVGLSLYFSVVCYVLDFKNLYGRLYVALKRLNMVLLTCGVTGMLVYGFFYMKLTVQSTFFLYAFYTHVGLVYVLMAMTLSVIILTGLKKGYLILHLVLGGLVIYFNPANYYLNYEGIVDYYQITYPNYFYWILCLEFVIFGGLLAWRYRKTREQNQALFQEKLQRDKKAFLRELQVQEEERLQIARDLHDDLGATLSAIKLVTTNSYGHDQRLTTMVAKANSDLRHFFSKLTNVGLKEKGIFAVIEERIKNLNAGGKTTIEFIALGNDNDIPEHILAPLYRIASELLSNILKHAEANEATLQLIVDTDHIQLLTEDNGVGYNTESELKGGMGLRNIRERVSRLEGEIHVSSSSSGTTTILIIPI